MSIELQWGVLGRGHVSGKCTCTTRCSAGRYPRVFMGFEPGAVYPSNLQMISCHSMAAVGPTVGQAPLHATAQGVRVCLSFGDVLGFGLGFQR